MMQEFPYDEDEIDVDKEKSSTTELTITETNCASPAIVTSFIERVQDLNNLKRSLAKSLVS